MATLHDGSGAPSKRGRVTYGVGGRYGSPSSTPTYGRRGTPSIAYQGNPNSPGYISPAAREALRRLAQHDKQRQLDDFLAAVWRPPTQRWSNGGGGGSYYRGGGGGGGGGGGRAALLKSYADAKAGITGAGADLQKLLDGLQAPAVAPAYQQAMPSVAGAKTDLAAQGGGLGDILALVQLLQGMTTDANNRATYTQQALADAYARSLADRKASAAKITAGSLGDLERMRAARGI